METTFINRVTSHTYTAPITVDQFIALVGDDYIHWDVCQSTPAGWIVVAPVKPTVTA